MTRSFRPLAVMAALGFASGLPLLLTGFTLKQWMTMRGADVHAIGYASLVGLPYSLKFLWAPFLDHARVPRFLQWSGRWRGWLLLTQPLLATACLLLAFSDPGTHPSGAMVVALFVAFFSANQDIAIDAWRIKLFAPEMQGTALACYIWGYRIAMLASTTGAIWLGNRIGYQFAYIVAAATMLAGIVPTLFAPAPAENRVEQQGVSGFSWQRRIAVAVIEPFRHFFSRAELRWALAFIALFNLGDGLAGSLTPKFYHDLGFSQDTVAGAIGFPNLAAVLAGMGFGGWIVSRIGVKNALILTGFVQVAAMSLYFAMAWAGPNIPLLYFKVMVNGFTGAMASAAFLAYLSQLCSSVSVATEYALLSSLGTLVPRLVDGSAGLIKSALGWEGFYGISIFASVPALLIMLHIVHHHASEPVDMRVDPG